MVLINNIFRRFPLLQQLFWFGIIGACAAAVQFICVVLLVEFKHLAPLTANIVGFILAFNVSYFGHRYRTFANTKVAHGLALPRLFLVAGSSFILNECLFYLFLRFIHLPYFISLPVVLIIVAIFTFILSKWWAFNCQNAL